jgi:membrane protein YdbS with pleckstrin-like domain
MLMFAVFIVAFVVLTIHAFWTHSNDRLSLCFTTITVVYMFFILKNNYEMFREEKQRNQVQSDRNDCLLNHFPNSDEPLTDKTAAMHV